MNRQSEYIISYEELIEKARATDQIYDERKIRAAYELAEEAHEGQTRERGEKYITHPLAVASNLLDLCMDTDTICAALLHDVVEDTDVPLSEIRRLFGNDVALLVDGVTKISKVHLNTPYLKDGRGVIFSTAEELKNENTRKILIAMSKDMRVIILKLADRLHNMRTLYAFADKKPDKCRMTALETMSFYAPLAHRLGMSHIKDEMENLSLFYLDRYAYEDIEKKLGEHKKKRETFIDSIKARIAERLSDMFPPPEMEGRVKGIYSLYKKMYEKNRDLDEIYDLYAVRVIVNTTGECYNVFGIMHDMFTPIPNRFKDYIANPKANGYQSLHTIVLGRERQPFEIQIRTREMHNAACYGIAAHWRYKLGGAAGMTPESRFEFIRNMLDEQDEEDNSLFEIVKKELGTDEVRVFTPKGDIIHLPKKSTALDFAYAIHTDIGNKMKSAKIHGKTVNFEYVLETGDIVDIELSDSPDYGPSRSWLSYAKTTDAKIKIRNWLKTERKEENVMSGKAYVDSVMIREGIITMTDGKVVMPMPDHMRAAIIHQFNYDTISDFFEAIGYGGLTTDKVSDWISNWNKDDKKKREQKGSKNPVKLEEKTVRRTNAPSAGVAVEGVEDCRPKFANCCTPVPGDEIAGFITRNNGVSVHRKNCVNVTPHRLSEKDMERLTDVRWLENNSALYHAEIEITAENDDIPWSDIKDVAKSHNFEVLSLNARIVKNQNAAATLSTKVTDINQLNALMAELGKIEGAKSVKRTGTIEKN